MEKIKILVAQHKEAEVFHNEVYIPIHVGKALSKTELGILCDDTGDNISHLNPYFCELTAQYWAWKNMHDVEYIGLCHYRRYFQTEFTMENVEQLMDGADIVLAKSIFFSENLYSNLSRDLVPEDILAFFLYMKGRFQNDQDVINFPYSLSLIFICVFFVDFYNLYTAVRRCNAPLTNVPFGLDRQRTSCTAHICSQIKADCACLTFF